MISLPEFIIKYNGVKGVGDTPQNVGQCVGVVEVWWDNIGGLPHVWGDAKDLPANIDTNFYEFIPNTPTGIPQAGDAIVWNAGFMGSAVGHTALATGGGGTDVNKFEVFEQNMPIGSACRLHTYLNYNYVAGWIRVKKAPATTETLDSLRKQRDDNWNLYQTELATTTTLAGRLSVANGRLTEIKNKAITA